MMRVGKLLYFNLVKVPIWKLLGRLLKQFFSNKVGPMVTSHMVNDELKWIIFPNLDNAWDLIR